MATMEMAGNLLRRADPVSRHRSQYKCSTPPWKEKYRKVTLSSTFLKKRSFNGLILFLRFVARLKQ